MTKKQNNIMIWLIIWAGLLVVVLYSPIGSPDLYYSQNYYTEFHSYANPGVIPNSPSRNYASDNSEVALDIPDVSSHLKTTYSVGSNQSTGGGFQGSSYSVQTQSYQNSNSSGFASSGSGGGSFIVGRGGSRNGGGFTGMTMTNGITNLSLTTDLTNTSTRQSVYTYQSGTGGTDPGGDPTGDPIPVGDGWGLLFFFGVCYASFKIKDFLIWQFRIQIWNKT
jgi:hypothetical protein